MNPVAVMERWGVEEKRVFNKLWKSLALSKVVAFAWKALLNRVLTKDNLTLRNVLHPEESTVCVMCDTREESSIHLFLHCKVASEVWSWVDYHFLIPPNLFIHWECWSGRRGKKNMLKGLWLIWHTTIWVLWKARNDKIFKGINHVTDELVEEIKVLSRRWMLERMNILVCLYYE
ncbi:putative reverse transcriptase zinc-binding domain-containing protein [Medicago truncatula]|uniref:Putative reverse transcriptase zinc-binding domain-containing protein n=1 Tax=Medicago truncatula TaxID=3880 RepID=A0A396GPJ9_MEDTR|nr:putative reverse transcriptase zinc-binding domain-containing protein [Medicago truncatula]